MQFFYIISIRESATVPNGITIIQNRRNKWSVSYTSSMHTNAPPGLAKNHLVIKMLTVFISIKWKKKMAVTLHRNTKQETGNKKDFRRRSHFRYCCLINSKYSTRHWWFSGRILACHAGGPGSIPGQCISFWYRKIKYSTMKMTWNLTRKDELSLECIFGNWVRKEWIGFLVFAICTSPVKHPFWPPLPVIEKKIA